MNPPSDTADAASQLPKERSESPSEELEPLSISEVLEAYDLLACQLASNYCGG